MIKFECDSNYNMYRYKLIGGKVTSIWNGDKVMLGGSSYPVIDFKYYTSDFCNFEKNISEANSKMVYHLSGYGALHNEAFSSYLGESSERYTFASLYKVIENIIEIGTYDEMYSKYGENKIPPLNLLNGYFLPTERDHYLSSECKIRWVPMNSLINPEEKVYVPLQMVISNDGLICKDEVQFMPSAVSTGTASQETFLKSLENAVIEYLQIDSFNLWWYGGCKGKKIEINTIDFLRTFFEKQAKINVFLSYFDIQFTDISFDKEIDVIVCEIFGKSPNLPQYTVGVQGGKDYKKTLYRSFMECLAVLEYNMHLPWLDPGKFGAVNRESISSISNLDDNIIYYSKYGKILDVKFDNDYFSDLNINKSYRPINSLRKLSKYACFCNVTLPEFENLNLFVSRVCIPELLPMCMPSYPPFYHARYKQIGGIRNGKPHPLA